jgi:transposase
VGHPPPPRGGGGWSKKKVSVAAFSERSKGVKQTTTDTGRTLYENLMKDKISNFGIRRAIVHYAGEHGIKAAARHYGCSRNTVRTWTRRFRTEGNQGLFNRSRAPKTQARRTPEKVEQEVVRCRQRSGFGAARLVEEFNLPLSKGAAHRIIRDAELLSRRPRKHHRKRDLRAVKAAYEPFSRFQMDTKDLCDIPHYWRQIRELGLPRYQYSIRELSTGAIFLSFSSTLSKTWSTFTIKRFLQHLREQGADLRKIVITTDLGTEFDGETRHYRNEGFHRSICATGATHRFNPPSCPNANADVESFHATVEHEFYDRETFYDCNDFLLKINTYQAWFNIGRKNRSRNGTPIQLQHQKKTLLQPTIFLLPPFIVESIYDKTGGQHLTGSPDICLPQSTRLRGRTAWQSGHPSHL